MKKVNIIKYLIGTIVIMLSSFGIIVNIIHFINIRDTSPINLKENNEYKQIRETINEVKTARHDISNSVISSTDMENVSEYINTCYEALSDLKLFKYEDHKELNVLEKYEISNNAISTRCPALLASSLNALSNYDEDIKNLKSSYAASLYNSLLSLELLNKKLLYNYKYEISWYAPKDIKIENKDMDMMLNSVRTQALILDYIVDYLDGLED